MKPALIDTDTLSYYFRNHPSVVEKLNRYLEKFGFVNISVITYYEVLNGLYFKDARKQIKSFQQFVVLNEVIPLTDDIAREAAEIYAKLRKKGVTKGHNDMLIAATAMKRDMTLVSNNQKHFRDIDGLDLDNWAE